MQYKKSTEADAMVGEQLRKKNIIEYVLYLFQVEDTIRAFYFDIDLIDEKILRPQGLHGYEHIEMRQWYKNFIDAMTAEKVEKRGHVSHIKNVLFVLVDLSRFMLKENNDAYKKLFEDAMPAISDLLQKSKGKIGNEIEACFTALYGVATLRMQNKEVTPATIEALRPITKLLTYLGKEYHEQEDSFGE